MRFIGTLFPLFTLVILPFRDSHGREHAARLRFSAVFDVCRNNEYHQWVRPKVSEFATMQNAMAHLPTSETAIADLLTPFLGEASLSEHQMHQVAVYIELLLCWNEKINLTAVRDPEEIVTRHFGECFFAARHLFSNDESPGTAIDIGSGAGFPGLPIKILAPNVNMTLVESNNKKVVFLREVVRSLGLADVNVIAIRAEEIQDSADLVTLRAVERFQKTLPIAGRLAKSKGRVALLIGGAQMQVAESLLPDVSWEKPIPVPLSLNRVFAIGHNNEGSSLRRPFF